MARVTLTALLKKAPPVLRPDWIACVFQSSAKDPEEELLVKDPEEELLLKDPEEELLLKDPEDELLFKDPEEAWANYCDCLCVGTMLEL